MLKLIVKHAGNNAYTTIAIETVRWQGHILYFWRKINESKTRYVGKLVDTHSQQNVCDYLIQEVPRLTDGEFVGWCN